MQIVNKNVNLDAFRVYVRNFDFGRIKPDSIVVHHTWSPKKSEWKGDRSVMGLRNYYEGKGWSAGPHLFIAEDGIWLFTPMSEVGIHAGEGNATWELLGRKFQGFRGPIGSKLTRYSIGIEVVGDYDLERWTGETLKNAVGAIKILMSHLNIPTESLYFHRDFPSAKKSCPGHAITKDWLIAELSKHDADGRKVDPKAAVSPWAKEGWEWQKSLSLDETILPQQQVTAEWVFAVLNRYDDFRDNNS